MASNLWLGNPKGVFDLSESDKYLGSYVSGEDIKTIFGVDNVYSFMIDFRQIVMARCAIIIFLCVIWYFRFFCVLLPTN